MTNLNEYVQNLLNEAEEEKKRQAANNTNEGKQDGGDPTIKDEKSFREAAKAKFEEVFGDKLDEKKMKDTIDGLLKDHADLVEKGEWAELIGILNQSFAKE